MIEHRVKDDWLYLSIDSHLVTFLRFFFIKIPLPIRILIPITYNSSRLVYLWHWAFDTTIPLGTIGRGMGIVNIVYWAINLFVFLIPIASLRYMRAHFFGVEAEEVTTRNGMEETLGLVPRNS